MTDDYGVTVALRNIEALDPYHRAEVRDTIVALEALADKYKWQRDECARWLGEEELGCTRDHVLGTLGHLWDLR